MGRFAVAVLLLCIAGAALAQQSDEEAGTRVSVGAGVINAPKYPGADSYRLRAIPVISLAFGRFFVGGGDPGGGGGGGGGGVGMNIVRDPAWRLGVALAPGFGRARRESDHPSLAGLGDIDRATRAVAFAGYTWGWLSANLRVATDIEGEDQGTLATFDLSARYRATPELSFSAGPGITWADDDYMTTFFGVSGEQAARSSLPAYEAKGGVHALRFGVGASYRFERRWSVGGRVSRARLTGDAADSPITRDRTQYTAAIFAAYRF